MRIYISLAFTGEKEESSALLRAAFEKEGISHLFSSIIKNENGKPYIYDSSIFFSITHSKNIWMCVFSDFEIGIDFQHFTKKEFEKLANRFFSKKETAFLSAFKEDVEKLFFDIWTRKEAAGKFMGSGIFKNGISAIETVEIENGSYLFRRSIENQNNFGTWLEEEKLKPLCLFMQERATKLEKFTISICGFEEEQIEGVFEIGRDEEQQRL